MLDHKSFDRDFKVMGIIFKIVFPIIFLTAICMFIFQMWVGFKVIQTKVIQTVDEHGLKAVVERVWEGPNGTIR